MNICGFQKLTLLDYPGHLAATIFTGGCQFRCPFCHNSSLLAPESFVDEEEILHFLQKRAGILEGVCLSGGEPTLQDDLPLFAEKIRRLGYQIKLDTNGYRPDVLKDLVTHHLLDYVAMDIKSSPLRYQTVSAFPSLDFSHIQSSVDFLRQNFLPIAFRTTVGTGMHQREDFLAIGEWLAGDSTYYLQAYQDSENVLTRVFSSPSPKELEEFRTILFPFLPHIHIRGED